MDRRIWRKIHLILLISSPHACFLFCRVEESSYELRKIKPVRKNPFAAWVEHDWSIGAEDRSIEKKKKKRSIANKRRKHGAQILKTSRRENGAMNCGGGGEEGKSMWKEVRTQKRVRSLASNVIFVNRWNAPKLAWLKPSVYCNASLYIPDAIEIN